MKCEFCEFASECKDPARYGGGCDIDGVDDFGCGTADVRDEEDEDDFGCGTADVRDEEDEDEGGAA